MAEGIRARLTSREGRRFAFTVGGALLTFSVVAWWRGRGAIAGTLAGAATLLLLAGVIAPGHLAPVQRAWMGLARALSKVTTPVFVTLVYLTTLLPVGLAMRVVGRNPLRHEATTRGYWIRRDGPTDRRRMERQF